MISRTPIKIAKEEIHSHGHDCCFVNSKLYSIQVSIPIIVFDKENNRPWKRVCYTSHNNIMTTGLAYTFKTLKLCPTARKLKKNNVIYSLLLIF